MVRSFFSTASVSISRVAVLPSQETLTVRLPMGISITAPSLAMRTVRLSPFQVTSTPRVSATKRTGTMTRPRRSV